eukprot:UN03127
MDDNDSSSEYDNQNKNLFQRKDQEANPTMDGSRQSQPMMDRANTFSSQGTSNFSTSLSTVVSMSKPDERLKKHKRTTEFVIEQSSIYRNLFYSKIPIT